MDDRDRIIAWIAERESKQIARRVLRYLEGITTGKQSDDDSGLANLWDEVCVQVQGEESAMWEYYTEMMREMIEKQVNMLEVELRKAIWLQTDNGFDWRYDIEDDDETTTHFEYGLADIVNHVLEKFVLRLAHDYKNRRIEKFIEAGREFD